MESKQHKHYIRRIDLECGGSRETRTRYLGTMYVYEIAYVLRDTVSHSVELYDVCEMITR